MRIIRHWNSLNDYKGIPLTLLNQKSVLNNIETNLIPDVLKEFEYFEWIKIKHDRVFLFGRVG